MSPSTIRIPLVSLCMASYNHAPFLPAALDSILAQTFRNFEIVVVDDGSTDGSLEILEGYARKYPETVRVFTHPGHRNLGISVTGNVAISNARGAYFCPHGSDDISYPDRLERQAAFLESHPDVGWVYGLADYIDKNGARLEGHFGRDLSASPDLVEDVIMVYWILFSTVMVRMHCMKQVGCFEPGMMFSDWEFVIRLAACFSPRYLPGAVMGYRMHDYNTTIHHSSRVTPEGYLEERRRGLEVFTTLRRKADGAEGRLGQPRIKALLDLQRAAFLIGLNDRASRACAAAFWSDPSLGSDLKRLARYLDGFQSQSLDLALIVIRQLGYPPKWLLNANFLSVLIRLGAREIGRKFASLRKRLRGSFQRSSVLS